MTQIGNIIIDVQILLSLLSLVEVMCDLTLVSSSSI
jgi:hypothetical protein